MGYRGVLVDSRARTARQQRSRKGPQIPTGFFRDRIKTVPAPDFDLLHEHASKLAALTKPGQREEGLFTWCDFVAEHWKAISDIWRGRRSETPTATQQEQFRLTVAVQTVNLLRDAIEANGNVYSGHLVPNFTSVTDLLVCDFDDLVQEVRDWPVMRERLTPQWNEFLLPPA